MLYFIKQGEHVKIGYTDKIRTRLSSLQSANPNKLEVVGLIEGEYKDELEHHNKFKHLSSSGEWFKYDADLCDYIAKLDKDLMWQYGYTSNESSPIGLIKSCRIENGLSLEDLGNLLGVTKQSVMSLEKREIKGEITIKSLTKALNAMGYKYENRRIKKS